MIISQQSISEGKPVTLPSSSTFHPSTVFISFLWTSNIEISRFTSFMMSSYARVPRHAGQSKSCLSTRPHNDRITNPIDHYLGCVKICERRDFYDSLPPREQAEISRRLRQIEIRRHAMHQSKSDAVWGTALKESLQGWRSRKNRHMRDNETWHDPNVEWDAEAIDYDPEKDVQAQVIAFVDSQGSDVSHPLCKGSFPNQTISVSDLLRNTPSLLRESRHPSGESRVRYFHLPMNNMLVPVAVACLFESSITLMMNIG